MSARGKPGADRAEQNRATLKSLVKVEGNKSCADCKRNKHPRWASWNLGIFICIRCSGIHRGMGTHISRVKSVDLDSWTDEQMQSMLRWGNTRANKYWEAKLAPGHVPSEAKIENFIRTKYESKRWVMDGPMPDPSTLGVDGDDDVPLNVVKEKAQLERSASQRAAASTSSGPLRPPPRAAPPTDLFGDDPSPVDTPPRPSTTEPTTQRAPPPPAKQQKPGDSLLGLDFFGSSGPTQAPRPASTTAAGQTGNTPSRPDLKQSILSLYASKPAATQPVHQRAPSNTGFGGLQSPPLASPTTSPPAAQSSFGGLNDAFSSLSFSSPASAAPKPSAFAGLTNISSAKPAAPQATATSAFGSSGSFFDAPAPKPAAPSQPNRTFSSNSGFGDFFAATSPVSQAPPRAAPSASNDLFDFSMPSTAASPPAPKPAQSTMSSAFNLSSSKPEPPKPQATVNPVPSLGSGWGNMDAWGSNDAWGSPDPAPTNTTALSQPKPSIPQNMDFHSGWGAAAKNTEVTPDDDFGGWSEAPAPVKATAKPAAGGFGASDDPFGNPWE